MDNCPSGSVHALAGGKFGVVFSFVRVAEK